MVEIFAKKRSPFTTVGNQKIWQSRFVDSFRQLQLCGVVDVEENS